MSETAFGVLKRCPECGGEKLIPVATSEGTNFFCQDCVFCWYLEHGRATVVDPRSCPGCQLGTTACFERWEVFHSLSSMMTRQGFVDPGESEQEDNMAWDDIEWELYCSAREAGVGCFHDVDLRPGQAHTGPAPRR